VSLAFERLAASNAADGDLLITDLITDPGAGPGTSSGPSLPLDEQGTLQTGRGEVAGVDDAGSPATARQKTLHAVRLETVVAVLKACGARRVIDIGCREGKLLQLLVRERQFTAIAGTDVSHLALERASEKLKLENASDVMRERIQLFQGSLTYRDDRFVGYDAACVVEVIEHLDLARLSAFERILFEFARPGVIVLTTPNREYNANYPRLSGDEFRHDDHRFEWTRAEFEKWATRTADRFGYSVQFSGIGDADETHGAPGQMGVFTICA
jgi:3' terminal RNA ribose 2'-O-methyltransferase Hen1